MSDDNTTKPTPDPTVLTTEQLLREIARLERLMESQVTGLRGLVDEKFVSVSTQFALIERQRVELKTDNQKAVDAAFTAATTSISATAKTIDDVKERVGKIESSKQGSKDSLAAYYALAGVALTIIIVVVAIMNLTTGNP